MKKIILLFAMTISAMCTYGQVKPHSFYVIPQVGVSLSKQTGFAAYAAESANTGNSFGLMDYQPKARYKAGFTAGLEVVYQTTTTWAVSLGAFYTQAGSQYKDFEAVSSSSQETEETNAAKGWRGHVFTNQQNTFDYVTIPVMAHYSVGKGFSVKAGVELGFLTSAKKQWDQTAFTVNEETNITTYDKPSSYEVELDSDAKGFILSIPVGVSYEYERVVLDARYHFPLNKAMRFTDTRNRLFTFTVGYRF